ncbi:MAG TPA: lysophospholipid acyltransferase family protein [Verrucomicrobiae bacterium]|nr:lysophospholipid acyltransferase family protein [Verrucomicrobiae bacterium]
MPPGIMQENYRVTRNWKFIQALLGFGATIFIALPYLRRTHGLGRLRPSQKYLFVANHVSLLDTILLGSLCWRSKCYPILTLGDKNVWHASWLKKILSSKIGFLVERGKLNPNRIRELQEFGRAGKEFHLLVFPEGTRGDGINVAACQPGIYFIAQEARLPIVPVFIENMHLVSTKNGKFHPVGGLRKIEVHFGEPIAPEKYLNLPREDFLELVQQSITTARQLQPTVHPATVKTSAFSSSNPPPAG